MDKLLEMLGVEKLDEKAQSKIKKHLDTLVQEKVDVLVEVKANELSESKLEEEKNRLIEEYEEKFEEYKEDITSKFSNFVDSILEEEMTIPEKIVEFAKKGELYHDLIEQFKVRLSVDEGLLDEEVRGLLQEAKDEIIKLRGDLDEKTAKELELERDAQKLAAELYLRQKADGLTESQKTHVFNILEGETDKEVIDKKFPIIVESIKSVDEQDEEDDGEEGDDKKKKKMDDEEDDGEEGDDKKKKKDEGKGAAEVDDNADENVDEDNSGPFQDFLKGYVSVLKENKI
jgi:hypothetical protein